MRHLLFLITFCWWSLNAATYYSSTTGNNSWNGTAPAYVSGTTGPKRTILAGIQLLSPGDTLQLRGGIYEEPSIDLPMSINGSSDANRTILKSYPGERAIFYPTTHTKHGINAAGSTQVSSNLTFDGWTIDFRRKNIEIQGHESIANFKMYWCTNITLTNMHFVNNTNGSLTHIYTSNFYSTRGSGGNVHVVDCLFSNVTSVLLSDGHRHDPCHPMYWNTVSDVLVERNLFIDGARTDIHTQSFGLHVYGGYQADRWIVRNNWFDGFVAATAFNVNNGKLYNNVFVNIEGAGIGQYSRNSLYANNTLVGNNGTSAIKTFGYNDDFVNNVAWGFGTGIEIAADFTTDRYITFTNNILPSGIIRPTSGNPYFTGTINADPLFADYPTDVSLGVGSPAIKTGVDLSSLFTTDYTGTTRTTPWDRGAYASEYDEGPEPEEPPIVPADAIYVSTTGSDSGAGTLASPYKTIKKGIEMLSAGGTLVLRGGNYVEASLAGDAIKSGPSPTQRTIIKSYPGERAVFKPTHHGAGSSLTTHAIGANRIKSNIVFDSWTIDTSLRLGDGVAVAEGDVIKMPAHNVMLTNMWFLNHPWGSGVVWSRDGLYPVSNMYSWSSNTHVVSCTFSNWNTATEKWGHPIYMLCWWKSIVENNLFVEGDKVAIQYSSVGTNLTSSDVVIRGNRIIAGPTKRFSNGIYNNSNISTNVWIYNNTIDVKQWGIYLMGRTNHVYNNTIYYVTPSPTGAGILPATGGPHYIANNIVWGIPDTSSANTILVENTIVVRLTNNIAGPKLPVLTLGTITQSSPFYGPAFDPLFTGAPTDLRISNSGAAAGTGVNLGSVFNTDINGFSRQVWDIGAYAVGSQSGTDDPEEPPPVITYPRVSVVQYGPAYEKDSTTATFVVFRDNYTDDLDVNYTLTGTAVENTNFTISPSSPATIAAGQNSVTITVTPIDTQYIGALTVILTLDEDASYTLSSPSSATMEILGSGQSVSGFRRTFGGGSTLQRRKL